MISRREVEQMRAEWALDIAVIEKDYLLRHRRSSGALPVLGIQGRHPAVHRPGGRPAGSPPPRPRSARRRRPRDRDESASASRRPANSAAGSRALARPQSACC